MTDPAAQPSIENLLRLTLPTWREANILAWCLDPQPTRRLLEGVGARVTEVNSGLKGNGSESLIEPRSGVEEATMFDGAVAIDILKTVSPDRLIDVLRWLHDRLNPGATLAVRVSTNLLGEEPTGAERIRFCAATYMTAFRRAGFGFKRFDRTLIDEHHPALTRARETMRFHDPLELRTATLDALLVRPDRVNLAELALVDK